MVTRESDKAARSSSSEGARLSLPACGRCLLDGRRPAGSSIVALARLLLPLRWLLLLLLPRRRPAGWPYAAGRPRPQGLRGANGPERVSCTVAHWA